MDRIKAFLQIRAFFNGSEFLKLLQLKDSEIQPNSLMREWSSLLTCVPPASRRVFPRFLYAFPTQCSKHVTEVTLRNGWKNIFVYPFNQRGMFEVVPGYKKNLTDEQRDALDTRIPKIVNECILFGYANASDEMIYKHCGDIIGKPRRGLPNDQDENVPPLIDEDDDEDGDDDEGGGDAEPRRRSLAVEDVKSGRYPSSISTDGALYTLQQRRTRTRWLCRL
jgi:hypothetical protein